MIGGISAVHWVLSAATVLSTATDRAPYRWKAPLLRRTIYKVHGKNGIPRRSFFPLSKVREEASHLGADLTLRLDQGC